MGTKKMSTQVAQRMEALQNIVRRKDEQVKTLTIKLDQANQNIGKIKTQSALKSDLDTLNELMIKLNDSERENS